MSNKELKPCPFCGSEAKYENSDGYHYIICDECGARNFGFSKESAFDEWNSRIITKLRRSDIEKMVKPLQWDNNYYGYYAKILGTQITLKKRAYDGIFDVYISTSYLKTLDTLEEAQQHAQTWLVDLICSELGVKE
jgi:Lar family restriction alleviation protein